MHYEEKKSVREASLKVLCEMCMAERATPLVLLGVNPGRTPGHMELVILFEGMTREEVTHFLWLAAECAAGLGGKVVKDIRRDWNDEEGKG